MGRYFTETDISDKPQIFKISDDDLNLAKAKSRNKKNKVKSVDYKKKNVRKPADPYPGRKPVDPTKIEEQSRGQQVDIKKIKSRFKQKEQRKREKRLEFAAEQTVRAEVLLAEEAGFLEGDDDHEFTGQIRQQEIKRAVDDESAAKSFDLNLQEFGPYKLSYTR